MNTGLKIPVSHDVSSVSGNELSTISDGVMCLLLRLCLLLPVQECSCCRHQYSAVIGSFFDAGRFVPDPSKAGQHCSCKEYQPTALHTS